MILLGFEGFFHETIYYAVAGDTQHMGILLKANSEKRQLWYRSGQKYHVKGDENVAMNIFLKLKNSEFFMNNYVQIKICK